MRWLKENNGITLIALAVTIIVLLIISGVVISSFTGENGIIKKADYSKNITNAVEEKEVLNTSVASSIGKSKKAKVEEDYLKKYLNQNVGEENKDYELEKKDKYYSLKFTGTGNEYAILENGTVLSKDDFGKKLEAGVKETVIVEVEQKVKINVKVKNEIGDEIEADSAIYWISENEDIAKVEVDTQNITEAIVLGVANGETKVIAQLENGKKCEFNIVVQTSPESITLNPNNLVLDLSEKASDTINVEYKPSTTNANKEIEWDYDTSIVSINSDGVIQGIKNGIITVTAKTRNDKTATCSVTVQTTPTGITLDQKSIVLDLNATKTMSINATIEPKSANIKNNITWSSSNTNVVTVSQTGTITAVGKGQATITATTGNGKKASCSVDVQKNPVSIKLDKTKAVLDLSETKTLQLTATVDPSDAATNKDLNWSSSNTKIITVSQTGVVTGIAKGTATITVSTVNGKKATCTITVCKTPLSVTLSPASATLDMSGTKQMQLTATVTPSDADDKSVTWDSSNKDVATVSSTGVVTAIGKGSTTITVSTSNGKKATSTITVIISITSISLNQTTASLQDGKTLQLTATVNPTNTTEKLTWKATNSCATVTQDGLVTAKTAGSVDIIVSNSTGTKTAKCTITINYAQRTFTLTTKSRRGEGDFEAWSGTIPQGAKYAVLTATNELVDAWRDRTLTWNLTVGSETHANAASIILDGSFGNNPKNTITATIPFTGAGTTWSLYVHMSTGQGVGIGSSNTLAYSSGSITFYY